MPKTVLRLSKKCALSNYSEEHRFETFDLTIETEFEEPLTETLVQDTFKNLRERLFEQEHDTIQFFLDNSHVEKEEPAEGEDENGDLII